MPRKRKTPSAPHPRLQPVSDRWVTPRPAKPESWEQRNHREWNEALAHYGIDKDGKPLDKPAKPRGRPRKAKTTTAATHVGQDAHAALVRLHDDLAAQASTGMAYAGPDHIDGPLWTIPPKLRGRPRKAKPADNDGRNVGINRRARKKNATTSSATPADAKPSRGVAPFEPDVIADIARYEAERGGKPRTRLSKAIADAVKPAPDKQMADRWAQAIEENKAWLASLDVERIEIEEAEKAREELAKDAQELKMGYPEKPALAELAKINEEWSAGVEKAKRESVEAALDKIDAQAEIWKAMLPPEPALKQDKAFMEPFEAPKPEPLFTEINPGTDWKAYYGTTPPEADRPDGIIPIPNPPAAAFDFWSVVNMLFHASCTAALVVCTIAILTKPPAQRTFFRMDAVTDSIDRLRLQVGTDLDQMQRENGLTGRSVEAIKLRLDATNQKLDEVVDALKHTHYWNR